MRRMTRRFGLVAAVAAVVVGGSAVVSGERAAAQAPCQTPSSCFTLGLPDLVVTNIKADNQGGGKTKMTFTVKNQGVVAANPFVHRLQIAGSGPWLVLSGVIPAGATKTYALTINTPPIPPIVKSVQVCADATNTSAESNEANNCLVKYLSFGIADELIAP